MTSDSYDFSSEFNVALLSELCLRTPCQPEELRFLEICHGEPLFTRSSAPFKAQHVTFRIFDDFDIAQPENPTNKESSAGGVPENDVRVYEHSIEADAFDLVTDFERYFKFHRLDYIAIPSAYSAQLKQLLKQIRPYLIHITDTDRNAAQDFSIADGMQHEYLRIASRSGHTWFVDALVFVRPEQAFSYIT